MNLAEHRPVDCDVHITVPSMCTLLPYLDEYWRDHLTARGTDRLNLTQTLYPPNAPITCRQDWRAAGPLDLAALQRDALNPHNVRFAICHILHTAQLFYSEDMAAALCRALNDWVADQFLAADPRLRAAIVVTAQNPELAVEEINRLATDRRFVAIQLLLLNEMPLGRRAFWPIYAAAERHALPVSVHAGSLYRYAPTPTGWPSYLLEDYVALSQNFQGQLLSLIAEGVFIKHPNLTMVMAEAGFTWLPGFLWRADKTWRGVRREVPWLTEPPSAQVRRHVRFTLQPANAPPEPAMLARVIEQIDCDDLLLFSTDYPHSHYDNDNVIPEGFPNHLLQRLLVDNPLATFTRAAPATAAAEEAVS